MPAIEKGFYADEGLDVSLREYDPAEGRIDPVLAGTAQYGIGGPELLADRSAGKPVVLLASIFQHSPGVLITRKDSGISDVHDLAGKAVMLGISTEIRTMIVNALGSLDQVRVVPYSYDLAAFSDGRVDAVAGYLSNEAFRLRQKGLAINIIHPQTSGIDFYGDNHFTTEDEIAQHRERVDKVLRATLRGWAYALAHKDEIIELILAKYSRALDREQLRFEAKVIDQTILPDLVALGESNFERYEQIGESLHRVGLSSSPKVPEGFIYKVQGKPNLALTAEELA